MPRSESVASVEAFAGLPLSFSSVRQLPRLPLGAQANLASALDVLTLRALPT
jgi:hypothetical protein